MHRESLTVTAAVLLCLSVLPGCVTDAPLEAETMVSPRLERAELLYRQGRYTEAITACIDLQREDPLMPGLAELQSEIVARLADLRRDAIRERLKHSAQRVWNDVERQKVIPETYGLQQNIAVGDLSIKRPPSPMELALQEKVTVHLEGVDLQDFVLAIGISENVNIVADDLSLLNKTMTVHAEDVPLAELLDYISRNLGVTFYAGHNVIWATPAQSGEPAVPFETRIYRLRKGISGVELETGDDRIRIVEAVERFVPAVPGADLLFDRKAHVLIVRNTRANLERVEEIVESLDICPPQILIEARFVTTGVDDLRELGIDWILTSPYVVTDNDGDARTVVSEGASLSYAAFPNQSQGLNFAYEGLLTDPMFRAVLHALEVSGNSRTLSVPKVTTVNNHPAMIRIGEDFRYFEEYDIESTPSTTDDGETVYRTTIVPVGTPQLEELGIELMVTPSVGADLGSITLNLVPEISEFVRYEFYETGGVDNDNNNNQSTSGTNVNSLIRLPIFRRSRIETEVIVQSGETVVMGGLITSAENETSSGVPILSELPFVGRFFRRDDTEETKQNLLIFVTARLISQRGEDLIPVSEIE